MLLETPAFDELHSISDLHLGGPSGFQMFAEGKLLGHTIDFLGDPSRAAGTVGLVINGDFVDFLAEDGATYLDVEGAELKLERIMGDPAFIPVFVALKHLVRTPKRLLIVA